MRNISLLYLAAMLVMAATPSTAGAATQAVKSTPVSHLQQQQSDHSRLTPQQVTDKLVRELGLNAKQRKRLRRLNEKYATLIANPRFKGRPQPVATDSAAGVDAHTGATSRATSDAAHIREQHARRNAYNAELKTILTSEQYGRYLSGK